MIRFHLDEHVPHAIAEGLRRRGIDVTTTVEAGLRSATDDVHLAYAVEQRRVIVLHHLVGLTVEIYRYDASVPDDLVDRLVQMFATWGPKDLVTNVGLPARAARVLSEALNRGEIKSVADLNHLKGFGKKSTAPAFMARTDIGTSP